MKPATSQPAYHPEETLLHAAAALLAHWNSPWRLLHVIFSLLLALVPAPQKRTRPFRDSPHGAAVGALLPLALLPVAPSIYEGVLIGTSTATLGLTLPLRAPFGPLLAAVITPFLCDCSKPFAAAAVPLLAAAVVAAAPYSFSAAEAALTACGAVCAFTSAYAAVAPAPTTAAGVAAALAGAVALLAARGVGRFRAAAALALGAVVPAYTFAWMYALRAEPVQWTIAHVVGSPTRRALVAAWTCALAACATAPARWASRAGRVEARKLYHVLITALFAPALALDAKFLGFACAGALGALLAGEVVRAARLPGASALDALAAPLLDARDGGAVVVTHLYLLVGCAAPVWLAPRCGVRAAGGLVTVGVLDAVAAVAGRRVGRTRWPRGAGRTLEGSAAGVVAGIVFCVPFAAACALRPAREFGVAVVAAAASGLLEAHSTQIDNLVLPLYFVAVFDAVDGAF